MSEFASLRRDALANALRRHLDGEVRFDDPSRRLYATDASIYRIEPLGVVLPRTVADLAAAVQIADELEVSIVPRGGGTSLSGQSIGPGLVIDCSKYLNNILDIDPVGRTARVQPGVVLDQLNRALEPHGLLFGPDVSTASRANLGGMIGNNSAGARSIVYGKTGDHVRQLTAILADGTRTTFGPVSPAEWDRRAEASTREGHAYRAVRDIVTRNADEIVARFPRILRRVSGYDLETLRAGFAGDRPVFGLHHLLVGSEGTLAVTAEAELNLVPRPPCRGLLVPHFNSLAAALDVLSVCLEAGPSAVELMDSMLIELSANNLALKNTMAAIRGRPAALLMVEFTGADAAAVSYRVHDLRRKLLGRPGLTAAVPALDPPTRDTLWNFRSASMPLLYGMPGDRKPVTFVEDTAVAPERLPEFAARFKSLLSAHGTDGCFYGHASVGCLHIRPLLNLKDGHDVARMRRIASDVTDLVLEFGGSLSGEHGDGLVRSEWNLKMFGPAVYEAFRQVKHAFDPDNRLNPGKVVDAPAMTEGLRYGPNYRPVELSTVFDYSRQEGFFRSIELCNGNGACRKTQGGAMCPSYRATRDERDSTRGRANALLASVTTPVTQPPDGRPRPDGRPKMAERWLHEVMDLCLMCKACKAECPSNVDMAKLKAEFLDAYYESHWRPLGHWLTGHVHLLHRYGAWAGPVIDWIGRQPFARWWLEQAAGIDRRRSLPTIRADHFRRWFAGHTPDTNAGSRGRVILLDDCFTTFNEPQIGEEAVKVLERAGYRVELADVECCGRALISKGFVREARDLARAELPGLARRVADGTPILGLEPSCLLTLADDWPDLVPGPSATRVAAAAELADEWLARQVESGACELALHRDSQRCVLHGHCHQKALRGVQGSAAALRLVPGLTVTVLDAGCCGMAGSFGYERDHYDLSVQIAEAQLLPALRSDPEATIAAPGTSCRHQIHDLAGRRALHPLEVIAENLGLAPKSGPISNYDTV